MKKHLTKLFAVFLVTFVAILMMGTTAQAKWTVEHNPYTTTPDMVNVPPNYYLDDTISVYFGLFSGDPDNQVWTIWAPDGEYKTEFKGWDTTIPDIIIVNHETGSVSEYNAPRKDVNPDEYTSSTETQRHYIAYTHNYMYSDDQKTVFLEYYTTPATKSYRWPANDGDTTQGNDIWYYPDGTLMKNCAVTDYVIKYWGTNGGNCTYYVNENGRGLCGYASWTQIDGKWYYFIYDSGGVILGHGPHHITPGSVLDEDNNVHFHEETNGWFFFDENGQRVDNQWAYYEGMWYYCEANGQISLCYNEADDTYWNSDIQILYKTWYEWHGAWYYFDANSEMVKNAWVGDYYLQADGTMAKNTWVDGYYVGEDGKRVDNATQSGWVKKNGYWYYYKDGKYVKNTMVDGYYLGSDGKLVTNTWAKINNKWYYFGSDGKKLTNSWLKYKGAYYHFDKNGVLETNAWVKSSGKWYYVGSNGTLQTNAWVKTNGKYYHVGSDGAAQANAWVKTNGKWYYLNGIGNPVTNTRIYYNGKYYRFNSAGVCIG